MSDAFKSSGLYIWGYNRTPIYIGKAERQPLVKRFSRYIFSKKSQCKVSENYTEYLHKGGDIKSVEQIKNEYSISPARAKGAKTFGEVGSEKIWFILIPIEKSLISELENDLIEIGFEWNSKNELPALINKARPNKK